MVIAALFVTRQGLWRPGGTGLQGLGIPAIDLVRIHEKLEEYCVKCDFGQ